MNLRAVPHASLFIRVLLSTTQAKYQMDVLRHNFHNSQGTCDSDCDSSEVVPFRFRLPVATSLCPVSLVSASILDGVTWTEDSYLPCLQRPTSAKYKPWSNLDRKNPPRYIPWASRCEILGFCNTDVISVSFARNPSSIICGKYMHFFDHEPYCLYFGFQRCFCSVIRKANLLIKSGEAWWWLFTTYQNILSVSLFHTEAIVLKSIFRTARFVNPFIHLSVSQTRASVFLWRLASSIVERQNPRVWQ